MVDERPHLGGSGDGSVSSSCGGVERETGLEPATLCWGAEGQPGEPPRLAEGPRDPSRRAAGLNAACASAAFAAS